ncbi:hypothetical protein ACNKHQ_06265 [Shigella flexneri]
MAIIVEPAPGAIGRGHQTPVKIAIVTPIMTQVMNLAFIGPLKHAGYRCRLVWRPSECGAALTGSYANKNLYPTAGRQDS